MCTRGVIFTSRLIGADKYLCRHCRTLSCYWGHRLHSFTLHIILCYNILCSQWYTSCQSHNFTGTKGRSILVYDCVQSYWLNQLNSLEIIWMMSLLSLLEVIASFAPSWTAFNLYFLISLCLTNLCPCLQRLCNIRAALWGFSSIPTFLLLLRLL